MIAERTVDYRTVFYDRYVSAFKAHTRAGHSYEFTDTKLIPLVDGWLKSVKRDEPCIDLGCGDGSLLHALKTMGFSNLSGVDVSAEQVKLARRVCDRVEQAELMRGLNDQPDRHFAAIFLFDVIEHLTKSEVLELMDVVRRKLRRGGLFVCHCPNGDSPFVGSIHAGDFTHETLLNESSARNLCELFGLSKFEAREHLGASAGWKGTLRGLVWRLVRLGIKTVNLVETGSAGSNVFTRQFCFKAVKEA